GKKPCEHGRLVGDGMGRIPVSMRKEKAMWSARDHDDRLSGMRPFALSPAQQRRLEKLSRDAGRSPVETFRYVLRDGFAFCEWEVRESLAADYDVKRRGAVSDDQARRRARQVIDAAHARRRSTKAARMG